ncbi:MAG: NTP transferase domain-containing protein [Pikeienuella sp.]
MARWKVLVLAGDRGPEDPVAQAAGVATKAFAPIAGEPMIDHVLAALEAAPQIGEIAVSIAADAPALPAGVLRLDAGPTPATSAAEGLAALGAPLLITTADHPLLSPAMIADFIDGAEQAGADAAAGASLREVVELAGNPGRRTYLKFSDGWLSGCNLFAVRTARGGGAIEFWTRIEADRKKPLRMALKIGLPALFRYLTGRLSRRAAAKMIGGLADCRAAIVLLDHPLAAHDVDKPSDLEFAARVLSQR